jgi:adenylate cyclase
MAFVGAVGSADSVNEIAVLGSAANLCARLSSQAAAGEILVSDESAISAGLEKSGFEKRILDLKGFSIPFSVSVLGVGIPV